MSSHRIGVMPSCTSSAQASGGGGSTRRAAVLLQYGGGGRMVPRAPGLHVPGADSAAPHPAAAPHHARFLAGEASDRARTGATTAFAGAARRSRASKASATPCSPSPSRCWSSRSRCPRRSRSCARRCRDSSGSRCASCCSLFIWHAQYLYFRRYALDDRVSFLLNALLLFVVRVLHLSAQVPVHAAREPAHGIADARRRRPGCPADAGGVERADDHLQLRLRGAVHDLHAALRCTPTACATRSG